MAMDLDAVKAGLPQAVPMVRTLDLRFESLEPTRAVMVLPDQAAYHNHVGGPHAGAMFTLAESASGALVLANFGDLLDRATPLAVDATIRYAKLAIGEVTAEAVLDRPADEVRAELDGGQRPEFGVEVTLRNAEGVVTGTMSIRWTLKPNAR